MINRNSTYEDVREKLSRQEKKILTFILEDLSNKEIGDKLFISDKTAKKHKSNIAIKLNIPGRDLGKVLRKLSKGEI